MNAKLKTFISCLAAISLSAFIFSCNPISSPNNNSGNGQTGGSTPPGGQTGGSPIVPEIDSSLTIDLSSSEITAAKIVDSMGFGWNLGNTLDANDSGTNWTKQNAGVESDWGLKNTASSALFKKLKASGIRSVRIPISWHNHVDADLNINSAWMSHVKEVVDMAYNEGLFVIINIHHDNYEGENLGTKAGFTLYDNDKTQSLKFVEKIWTQVAEQFKAYDGHLIFETLNEPRVVGGSHEWGCDGTPQWACTTCKQRFAIINSLNQKALDIIRASGGNNANRVVMFPAYVAAPYAAINAYKANVFKIPTDSATNRLALSVHMYTPYNFAMEYPGNSTFTSSHKSDLASHFTALNDTFISKGIPVVIGEMGATNKDNFAARKEWFTYYLDLCKQYKVAAVLWDNGNEKNTENGSESFGYMNRNASGGPDWFTNSNVADLIAAAVEARGTSDNSGSSSNGGGSSSSDPEPTPSTGTALINQPYDLNDSTWAIKCEIASSKFTSATNTSYIKVTYEKCSGTPDYAALKLTTHWDAEGTECSAAGTLSNNLSFASTDNAVNLSVPSSSTNFTFTPTAANWNVLKEKGLILYGYGVKITAVELF